MLYLILNNLKQVLKNKFQIFISCIIFGLGLGFIIGYQSYNKNENAIYSAKTKADKVPNFVVNVNNNLFNSLVSLKNLVPRQYTTRLLLQNVQKIVNRFDIKYNVNYSLTSLQNLTQKNYISRNWESDLLCNENKNQRKQKFLEMSLQKIEVGNGEKNRIPNIDVQMKSFLYATVTNLNSSFYRNKLVFTNFSNKINTSNKNGSEKQWNEKFESKNFENILDKINAPKDHWPDNSFELFHFDFSKVEKDQKINIPCMVSKKWAQFHNLTASSQNYLEEKKFTKKNIENKNSTFKFNQDSPLTFYIVGYTDNPEFYQIGQFQSNTASIPFTIATPIIVPNLSLLYLNYLNNYSWNFKINDRQAEIGFNLFNNLSSNSIMLSKNEQNNWQKFFNSKNFKDAYDFSETSISTTGANIKYYQKKNLSSRLVINYEQFNKNLSTIRYFVYVFSLIIILISAILLIVIIKKQFDALAKHFGVLKAHGYTNLQIGVSWLGQSVLMSCISVVVAMLVSTFFLLILMRAKTNISSLFNSTSYTPDIISVISIIAVAFMYIWAISIFTTLFSLRIPLLTLLYQGSGVTSLGTIGRKIAFFFRWAPFTVRFGILTVIAGNIRTIILIMFIFLTSILISIGIFASSIVSSTYKLTYQNDKWNYNYSLDNKTELNKPTKNNNVHFNFFALNNDFSDQTNIMKTLDTEIYATSRKFWGEAKNFKPTKQYPDKSTFSDLGKKTLGQIDIDNNENVVYQSDKSVIPGLLLRFNKYIGNTPKKITTNKRTYFYSELDITNLANKRWYISRDSFTEVGDNGKINSVFDIHQSEDDCITMIRQILNDNLPTAEQKFNNEVINLITIYYSLLKNSKIHFMINHNFFLISKNSDYVANVTKFRDPKPKDPEFKVPTQIKNITYIDPSNKACLRSFQFLEKINKGFKTKYAENNYQHHIIPIVVSTMWAKKNHCHINQEIPISYYLASDVDSGWINKDPNGWNYKIIDEFKSANNENVYANNEIQKNIVKEIKSENFNPNNNRKWPLYFYETAPFSKQTRENYIDKIIQDQSFTVTDATYSGFTLLSNSIINYSYSNYISEQPFFNQQNILGYVDDKRFTFSVAKSLLQQIKIIMVALGVIYILVSAAAIVSLNYYIFHENIRAISIVKIMGTSGARINCLFVAIYFPIIVATFTIGFVVAMTITNAVINFLHNVTNVSLVPNYNLSQYVTAITILIAIYLLTVFVINYVIRKIKINRFLI